MTISDLSYIKKRLLSFVYIMNGNIVGGGGGERGKDRKEKDEKGREGGKGGLVFLKSLLLIFH